MPSPRQRVVATCMIFAIISQSGTALSAEKPLKIRPASENPVGGTSEFYSTDKTATLLIRVNIGGDVAKPGAYFLPRGVTLTDAIFSAGGPTGTASYPEISVLRGGAKSRVDVLNEGRRFALDEGDMLVVDRSFLKGDMPLIVSTISAITSILAFVLLIRKEVE